MKKILIVCLFVFLFCLKGAFAFDSVQKGGSAIVNPSNSENSNLLVDEAFANLENAYESRLSLEMAELLDNDFENLLDFKAKLEKYFLDNKEIQIHFITDSETTDKDKISVRVHWFKKVIDNAGVFRKVQGSSQFVFKKSDGTLKLLYLHGDNPFYS